MRSFGTEDGGVSDHNAPMRPPTRTHSDSSSTTLDEDEQSNASTIPWLQKKDSIRSERTGITADETISSESASSDRSYRRVRFAMAVKRYFVESHKSFSPKEKASYYSTQKDLAKTKSKVEKIAARIAAGKPEKRSSPYRGLYWWTKKGAAELDAQIDRTLTAVMDEQDKQWEEDVVNEVRIAFVSRKVTAASVERALYTAYEDEIAAAAVYGSSSRDSSQIFADDDSTVGSMASFASAKKSKRDDGKRKPGSRPRRRRGRKADHVDPRRTKTAPKKRVSMPVTPKKKSTPKKRVSV